MSHRNLFSFVLILTFSAGAALAGPSQEPRRAVSPNCRECHAGVSLEVSVHGELACLDCHGGIEIRQGTPPHQAKKEIPAPSCTAACHREPQAGRPGGGPTAYPDSVHGRAYLERQVPEVARCWDCHGRHDIKPAADPDSVINRRNIPLMCSRCHEDMSVVMKYNIHAEAPYQEYRRSVHGRALFDVGLVDFAAVCTDCHGVHNIQGAGTPHLQAKDPATCGNCHRLIFEQYSGSIHGREALKGNPDVPICVDCHGEHKVSAAASPQAPTSKLHVPDTCSGCHARPEIMKKYGVPADRVKTFIESFHGIAIGFGDKAEASCVDCHGVHNILPASDPESKVSPANLPKTCGQTACHPAMPAKIAGAKIHRDYARASSGVPFYVRKILSWAVLILVVLTVIFFIPALIRRFREPRMP